MTFRGTEFTTSGLVNSDTVTSVTLTSPGAAATAAVAGSPYSIIPSAAVGTGLGNYNISYVDGSLTVNKAALTVTANSTQQDLRPGRDVVGERSSPLAAWSTATR